MITVTLTLTSVLEYRYRGTSSIFENDFDIYSDENGNYFFWLRSKQQDRNEHFAKFREKLFRIFSHLDIRTVDIYLKKDKANDLSNLEGHEELNNVEIADIKKKLHNIALIEKNSPNTYNQGPLVFKLLNSDADKIIELLSLLDTCKNNDEIKNLTSKTNYTTNESLREVLELVKKGNVDIKTAKAIITRRGQAAFRKSLLDKYGTRCVITGCTVKNAIEAAHILPYAECLKRNLEPHKISNGILLRADIHTLFDLNFIRFDLIDEEKALRWKYCNLGNNACCHTNRIENSDRVIRLDLSDEEFSELANYITLRNEQKPYSFELK